MKERFIEKLMNIICNRMKNTNYIKTGLISLLLVGALTAGCGIYSFSGSLAPHLKTVAIPLFEDNTAEFGVKETLTDAVIEEFTNDNTLKIADLRNADSVVKGKIVRVADQHGAFTAAEQVQEIKVYITVQVIFEDLKKRQTLWEDRISEWGSFDPNDPSGRQTAIEDAIQKIAADILNKTVTAW